MSDAPAPLPPGGPPGDHPRGEGLTPGLIEQVLADFRQWLSALPPDEATPEPPAETVDLHTLAGHFIALRQEVNLQTRAVRSALEQNGDALRQLEELARRPARPPESAAAADEQLRPLLKAVIDVYDALALARRQVERLRDNAAPALDAVLEGVHIDAPPEVPPAEASARRGFWGGLFGGRGPADDAGKAREALERWRQKVIDALDERQRQTQEAAGFVRQAVDSVVTGYAMSLARIERVLPPFGIEPIEVAGQRFDPDTMEVLEAVTGTGRPEGEVVDEVRRGYRWRGQVFRFAQVRVAR